jgi:hypothetical protein
VVVLNTVLSAAALARDTAHFGVNSALKAEFKLLIWTFNIILELLGTALVY